ncbi:MAG: helix-turn-helix domain-containing protein [Trebonia sp.]
MDSADDAISDGIEVVPVVVVSQTFPARPSSIPDIRDFVRRCLAHSPLSEQDNREVGETVSQALLEAAGPTGAINVSFRIFPDHVEVDVLKSSPTLGSTAGLNALSSLLGRPAGPASAAGLGGAGGPGSAGGFGSYASAGDGGGTSASAAPAQAGSIQDPGVTREPGAAEEPEDSAASFADWMAEVLRREGMTMEAAARQLGVSVKTVSRWVGGATEPRLRDLRRIRELFGEMPFP